MSKSDGVTPIVFFVTSVIAFKDKKLSYFPVRSKYSPTERILQTRKTIESIRKNVDNSYIVLIEGGFDTFVDVFVDIVDEYRYLGDKLLVRKAVDSTNKSLGEAIMMLYSGIADARFKNSFVFKISGRYSLNSDFTLSSFPSAKFGFRPLHGLSTKLYSLGTKKHSVFFLYLLLSLPFLLCGKSIEATLGFLIYKGLYKTIPILGVEGLAGPIGTFYKE